MNPSTRRIVETLVLAATAVLMLGHGIGGSPPTCITRKGETRAYNVVGTCGPTGVVTVTWSPSTFCSVTLTGDDVGLPTSGNLSTDLNAGFDLYGTINSDWDLECNASPHFAADAGVPAAGAAVPAAAGALGLGCVRRPSAGNPTVTPDRVPWCQGALLPVTPTCDIHTCPTAACSNQEHTAFPASGCCPVCVPNGPDDAIPTAPPPVCHIDTCPQSCPAGQELSNPTDACCSTCQTPPQECLDGRTQWLTDLQAQLSSARACAVDADCAIATIGSRCEATCPEALAVDQIPTVSAWAGTRGDELCASCNTQAAACTANQPMRAACGNGSCVLLPL
jgi:hypothetical protein